METELDTLSTREYTPFLISDEDKRELREEILPYWRAHHYAPPVPREAKNMRYVDPDNPSSLAWIMTAVEYRCLPHFIADYEKVLKKGFLGVKKEAEERIARLDLTDPEQLKKLPFLEAVVMVLEAAAGIGRRFAARARELAAEEADGQRRSELLKIAAVCDRVPAHPARTFYEALQSVWITHAMLVWEVYH